MGGNILKPSRIEDLGQGIRMIDGYDLKRPGRTGIYVLGDDELTLVETGPSLSVPYILGGLEELGKGPEEVKNIIVTHIHLDHAGGAGLLMKSCPQAQVIVHPRGARHLANPSRLIQGARMVYGDDFDPLFDPILPIPEERIVVKGEGETLTIDSDRTLTFMDSPGHAAHHLSIYDPASNGLFTGDTAGIRFCQRESHGFSFYLPSTSPNQFDPEAMRSSIQRFRNIGAKRVYLGHFGMVDDVEELYQQVLSELSRFMAVGEDAFRQGKKADSIAQELKNYYIPLLRNKGIPKDDSLFDLLNLDLNVSAMGIEHYLTKQKKS